MFLWERYKLFRHRIGWVYVHAWKKHDKQSYFMLNKVFHCHLIAKSTFTLASILCDGLRGGSYWTVYKFLLFLLYLFSISLHEAETEEQTAQFCWPMGIQEVNTVFIRTDAPFKEFKKLRRESKEQMQEFTVPQGSNKNKSHTAVR